MIWTLYAVSSSRPQSHLQYPCNKAMVSNRNDVDTISLIARIAMRQNASYPKPFKTLTLPFVGRAGTITEQLIAI